MWHLLSFRLSEKQKQPPEVFYKKGVLKILQYSQENTCAWASFLIKKIKKEEINLKISDRLAYEEMLPVTYIIIKVKWIPKMSIKSDTHQDLISVLIQHYIENTEYWKPSSNDALH